MAWNAWRNPRQRRSAVTANLKAVCFAIKRVGKCFAHLQVRERFKIEVHLEKKGGCLRVDYVRLRQLGFGVHLGDLRRLEADDVEVASAVGFESDGGVLDID